jgi:hypothetical protein
MQRIDPLRYKIAGDRICSSLTEFIIRRGRSRIIGMAGDKKNRIARCLEIP